MKTGIMEASTSSAVKDPINLRNICRYPKSNCEKTRYILIAPVVEVVNVDHEGEVGEGSQHEGGDEAGSDVVAGLPHKVHHHLETLI